MTGNPMLQRGWRDRQAKAKAGYAAGDDEKRRVDAERAAYFAEKDRLARLEQEQRKAAQLTRRVTCICCDGDGHTSVSRGELIIRALAQLPAGSRIDENVIGMLAAIADGHQPHVAYSLPADRAVAYPRPAGSGTSTITVTGVSDPAAVSRAVADRLAQTIMPATPDDAAGSDDEALAAYRAPETAKPKATRRHAAPPFLQGGE